MTNGLGMMGRLVMGFALYSQLALGLASKTRGLGMDTDPGTFGFEIGNGNTVFRNEKGAYSLVIGENWEAGKADEFSEIILPLMSGTPRATVQINVIKETAIPPGKWIEKKVAGMDAIQKDTVRPTGVHDLEIRVFRSNGETVVINILGRPSLLPDSGFQKIMTSVDSFAFLEK